MNLPRYPIPSHSNLNPKVSIASRTSVIARKWSKCKGTEKVTLESIELLLVWDKSEEVTSNNELCTMLYIEE